MMNLLSLNHRSPAVITDKPMITIVRYFLSKYRRPASTMPMKIIPVIAEPLTAFMHAAIFSIFCASIAWGKPYPLTMPLNIDSNKGGKSRSRSPMPPITDTVHISLFFIFSSCERNMEASTIMLKAKMKNINSGALNLST